MLIVPDEIKIQIDETIKKGISKEDFILWIEEDCKQ
jgi:hypothetical protein